MKCLRCEDKKLELLGEIELKAPKDFLAFTEKYIREIYIIVKFVVILN